MKKGDKVQLNELGYKGYSKGAGSDWNLEKEFGYAIINVIDSGKQNYIDVNIYNKRGKTIGTIGGCADWFEPYEEPFNIKNAINDLNKLEIKLKKDE